MGHDLGMDFEKAEIWSKNVESETKSVNALIEKVEKLLATNDAEPDEITTALEEVTAPIIRKCQDMILGFKDFIGYLSQMINGSKVQAYQAKENIKKLNK